MFIFSFVESLVGPRDIYPASMEVMGTGVNQIGAFAVLLGSTQHAAWLLIST